MELTVVQQIQATPMWYRGTQFRSTLEADWACTFDSLNWAWGYEPVSVQLEGGINYRPDFWLPTSRTWAEVKGPHNERIDKALLLSETFRKEEFPDDEWEMTRTHVVILRPPGPGETCVWENPHPDVDMVVVYCPECSECGWMDYAGVWRCPRGCRNGGENRFWDRLGGELYRSGQLPFQRAPKFGGR
jgi:hypothetical protein